MVFGIIVVVIIFLWIDYKIIRDFIDKIKNRTQTFTYTQSGLEYIGIIERSYAQMVMQNSMTTIEIDGQAFTQKTGEKCGYNIAPGDHFIRCYEGGAGANIGAVTLKVNVPYGMVCKITYTASQLPGVVKGTIKHKIVQK